MAARSRRQSHEKGRFLPLVPPASHPLPLYPSTTQSPTCPLRLPPLVQEAEVRTSLAQQRLPSIHELFGDSLPDGPLSRTLKPLSCAIHSKFPDRGDHLPECSPTTHLTSPSTTASHARECPRHSWGERKPVHTFHHSTSLVPCATRSRALLSRPLPSRARAADIPPLFTYQSLAIRGRTTKPAVAVVKPAEYTSLITGDPGYLPPPYAPLEPESSDTSANWTDQPLLTRSSMSFLRKQRPAKVRTTSNARLRALDLPGFSSSPSAPSSYVVPAGAGLPTYRGSLFSMPFSDWSVDNPSDASPRGEDDTAPAYEKTDGVLPKLLADNGRQRRFKRRKGAPQGTLEAPSK